MNFKNLYTRENFIILFMQIVSNNEYKFESWQNLTNTWKSINKFILF
jgi:hypothetical protein